MTFRRFLDCCEALLVEEYRHLGADLLTALERTENWAARAVPREGEQVSAGSVAQNDAALAALKSQLAGVSGFAGASA